MEALVLDNKYDAVAVMDTFESFVWSDRYREYGEFEVELPATVKIREFLKMGYYLMLHKSSKLMIIETLTTTTDIEDGDKLNITGRSLESILERRIIWQQTILSGSLQNGIEKLLNENVINPSISARKIPGVKFIKSTDPAITSLTVESQFFGENLYDAVKSLCDNADIGFSMTPNFNTGEIIFELYKGVDRSYAQDLLPWVVFSPKYDNLLSSNFIESKVDFKNTCLIAGSGEEYVDKTLTSIGTATGLDRLEIFVDASSISKTVRDSEGNETELTAEEYEAQLKAKGDEELANYKETAAFSGDVDPTRQFVYGEDFFIGDVVQVVNEYGNEMRTTVSEIVFSQDSSGESMTPTFTAIE